MLLIMVILFLSLFHCRNTGMATDVDVIASVLSGITVASMNAG